MMKKRVLAGIAGVLLIAGMLAGCGSEETPETTVPPTEIQQTEAPVETTAAPVETTAATEAPVVTEAPVNPNSVVVETPYGKLEYQDQWNELMKTEQTMDGDNLIVSFYSEINSVRYTLFELTIGTAEGTAVGQITDADGVKRDVYIHMEELTQTESLSSNEQNRLFAMQEDINYVIENLK